MHKSIHLVYTSVVLLLFSTSCTHINNESTDIISKILPNGQHLVVEKINKETTSIGIITKHNYGTTHSFNYKITLDKMGVGWNGGSGEPKHLLFCKDTLYIHYLKNKWVEDFLIDSLDVERNGHFEVKDVYQKHIDKRYFFKLFGDAYWVETTLKNYMKQKLVCDEFEVPNDNELVL